jgi:hypothetical protein
MSGPLPEIVPRPSDPVTEASASVAEEAVEPTPSPIVEQDLAADAPAPPSEAVAVPDDPAADTFDPARELVILDELEAWLKAIKR